MGWLVIGIRPVSWSPRDAFAQRTAVDSCNAPGSWYAVFDLLWDAHPAWRVGNGDWQAGREHGRRAGIAVEMDFQQTTGDLTMFIALTLVDDHRRKLLILTALSFLALC